MTDQQRESPAEFGKRLAAELLADHERSKARAEQVARYLDNRAAAQRHVQATSGSVQDANLLVFKAGGAPLSPPGPKLVKTED